jgi:hypothetical protein
MENNNIIIEEHNLNNNNNIDSETIKNHYLICKYYYILEATNKLDEIIKNEEDNSDLFNTIQKIIKLNKEFCVDFNKKNINQREDFIENIKSKIYLNRINYYLALQCDITSDIRKEEKKQFSFIHYKKLSKFLRNLHYSITQDQWNNINDVNTKHLFLSNNNLYGEKTKIYFLNFLEKGYIQENLKWLNLDIHNIQSIIQFNSSNITNNQIIYKNNIETINFLKLFNNKLESIIQLKINQYIENKTKYYQQYSLKIIEYIMNNNN